MAVINGCQEGKATPKLVEVLCPECGEIMEVFVRLGGGAEETGCVVSDETCPVCGYVISGGTHAAELKKA